MPDPTKSTTDDGKPSYLEWLRQYHPEEFAKRFQPHPMNGPGDVPEDHFGKDPKEEWK